jgi:hypothetical protein
MLSIEVGAEGPYTNESHLQWFAELTD